MTQIEVTYEDLEPLLQARSKSGDASPVAAVLDRYIEAARAAAPSLPEGEVVYRNREGQRVLLIHREGYLYASRTASHAWAAVSLVARDRLEPYVPVFSPEAVDRAAMTLMLEDREDLAEADWVKVEGHVRERYRRYAREGLKAAGGKTDGEMDKPWLEDPGKKRYRRYAPEVLRQTSVITLDLSPWPESKAEDWRKEASILREQRPDVKAAAALCDAVADAMEAQGVRGPSL